LSELHGKPDFKPAIAIKWAARRRQAERERERDPKEFLVNHDQKLLG
jgi:hypothetical protein